MKLRKLQQKDAKAMLDWMYDKNVTQFMYTDFASKTIEDAVKFIDHAQNTTENMNLAIASDADDYMGTVSLKHIDKENKTAEFAITVSSQAMGKGYSWFAMTEIIRKAFEELKLNAVYWCVSEKNKRAVRFYDKHGFKRIVDIPQEVQQRYEDTEGFIWYVVLNGDDYRRLNISKGKICGCKVIDISTIPTLNAGELSFFEAQRDIDFEIKRMYYISKVPEGTRRGFHAHKQLKQMLFCPYGKIQLILDNGIKREEITLDDPSIGIIIDKPTWREMLWLEKNSVLCVATSDYYNKEDYIRDYGEFAEYIKMEDY